MYMYTRPAFRFLVINMNMDNNPSVCFKEKNPFRWFLKVCYCNKKRILRLKINHLFHK